MTDSRNTLCTFESGGSKGFPKYRIDHSDITGQAVVKPADLVGGFDQ